MREVEAESVAYLVVTSHGIDSDSYSLPYVTGWAGGDEPEKVIAATGARVIATAHHILESLATSLEPVPESRPEASGRLPHLPGGITMPGTRRPALLIQPSR